jgi:hypothetical protein
MEAPFHLFANLIDLRFKGSSQTHQQRDSGYEFFDEYLKILNLRESEEPVLRTVQSFRPKSGKIH